MKLNIKVFVLILIFSAVLFQPVFSQEKETLNPGQIVVTAHKTKTSIKDFPGSLSVKDKNFFQDHGVKDLKEAAAHIPNLFFKSAGSGDLIVSRGISTIDTSLFTPMGLYIDDISYPLNYMQNQSLLNVERIEILRGPQGTLYGRNSEAGVINIVTKEPDNFADGKVFFETGNYSLKSAGFFVDGPVVKNRFFAGISGEYKSLDGFTENEMTGNDKASDEFFKAVKGSLKWVANENFEALLTGDFFSRDKGMSNLRFENGPNASDYLKVISSEEDDSNEMGTSQALKIKYNSGGLKFTSITGHRLFNKDFIHDFDRTYKKLGFTDMDLKDRSLSQELRLASSPDLKFSWITGFYSEKEEIDVDMIFNHINPKMHRERGSDSEISGYAFFGQGTYSVFEKLKLTAGLRYDSSESKGKQVFKNFAGNFSYEDDFSDNEILPSTSVTYSINENINTYLSFSKGWLAGGYNYFSATNKETFSYDPEYTSNYEAGLKIVFFKNRFNANFSVFYTDIDDKQVREEVPGAGPGVWKFTNAASAYTKGAEFEINGLLGKGLSFFAGAGYADSRIDEWKGRASGKIVDYSDKHLPWAPDFTYNFGLSYYMANGLYFSGDVSGCGKRYFDAANSIEDDGYALVNLKTGMKFGSVDFSIWCKNLFDEEYANKKVKNMMNHTMVEDGDPMTFGATISWEI